MNVHEPSPRPGPRCDQENVPAGSKRPHFFLLGRPFSCAPALCNPSSRRVACMPKSLHPPQPCPQTTGAGRRRVAGLGQGRVSRSLPRYRRARARRRARCGNGGGLLGPPPHTISSRRQPPLSLPLLPPLRLRLPPYFSAPLYNDVLAVRRGIRGSPLRSAAAGRAQAQRRSPRPGGRVGEPSQIRGATRPWRPMRSLPKTRTLSPPAFSNVPRLSMNIAPGFLGPLLPRSDSLSECLS